MTDRRRLLRTVLALVVGVSTQGLLFVQVSFSVNQDWIAETLCANPDTDCDGSCVLRDRMAHASGHGHDHDHEAPATANLELALSIRPLLNPAPRLVPPAARRVAYPGGALLASADGAASGIFRPPRETVG